MNQSGVNECVGKVSLDRLHNTRDLGGYRTMDGRYILPKRLIRSGALSEATDRDLETLRQACNLGTVVDFRTHMECVQKPDPEMDGVLYLWNPILAEQTTGITFEEEKRGDGDVNAFVTKLFASFGTDAGQYMDKLYANLVLDEQAAAYYGNFFDILCDADEKAVLWHCSAGKDRVGVGTALLLTALSVDRQTILQDFLYTNDCVMEEVEKQAEMAAEKTGDERLYSTIKTLLTVADHYLDNAFAAMEAACGTAEAYLEERIGVTPEKREILMKKYLTD